MNDKYDNIIETTNFIYITESIPTSDISDSLLEEFVGCNCTDICTIECDCYKKSGINYTNRILIINDLTKPAYECNGNCSCTNECKLKLIQYGPIGGLKLTDFIHKGNGLITENDIPKGAFVCEYAGEYITNSEAEIRHKLYQNRRVNYIFWLKEHFGDNIFDTIIDPTQIGNIGRFINHSCQPNCDLIPIRVDTTIPRLCVFTNRDIKKGEEITFDYGCNESGMICDEGKKVECFCEANNCKKYLPFHQV